MKMYFYYGAMGSSKTANALMTRFSWESKGKKVALIKPQTDTRDGITTVKSRAGLSANAIVLGANQKINDVLFDISEYDNIIVDEVQFLTTAQIDELRYIADNEKAFIMCYGLKTDFKSELFEGSKRLLEVADKISEIVSMCPCGKKATMNARYSGNKIVYSGEQIAIGGNESYIALCHKCYMKGTIDLKTAEAFMVEKD